MPLLTVTQARKRAATAEWVLEQTSEGWLVKGDGEVLMTQTRRPRTFIDLNRAIERLKNEIGIKTVKLVTMQ